MLKYFSLLALLLMATPAQAQIYPTTSYNLSGTVAVTSTFQSIQTSQKGSRKGCTIQNNGTHTMYVYFGPIASATLTNAFQVPAASWVSCMSPGTINVLQDQVSITGTTSDAFVANFQ